VTNSRRFIQSFPTGMLYPRGGRRRSWNQAR
jgi:hypothetical protein